MKRCLVFRIAVSLALLLLLALPTLARAGCNKASDEGCPFQIGVLTVDRCFTSISGGATDIGNLICDVRRDIVKATTTQLPPLTAQIDRELQAARDAILRDAVNADSIKTFNRAADLQKKLEADVKALLNDSECGVNGTLKGLELYFQKRQQELLKLVGILQASLRAVEATGPAVGATGDILTIINNRRQEIERLATQAKTQIETLKASIEQLQKVQKEIAELPIPALITDTGTMVATIGPWTLECGACAGILINALSNVGIGTAAAGGGTAACPETVAGAGGSCWALPGGLVVTGIGGVEAALGGTVCTAALEGGTRIGEYVNKIDKLFKTVNTLSTKIQSSVQAATNALNALNALVQDLTNADTGISADLTSDLEKIGKDIETIQTALNRAFDIVNGEVIPPISEQSTERLREFQANFNHLVTCYNKIQSTFGKMTKRVLDALSDLSQALVLLVDGGKVVQNISDGCGRTITASVSSAQTDFNGLKNQVSPLLHEFMNINFNPLDPQAVETKVNSIKTRLSSLTEGLANLAVNAVKKGSAAFHEWEDEKQAARTKFNQAGDKARSALAGLELRITIRETAAVNVAIASTPNLSRSLGTKSTSKVLPINATKLTARKSASAAQPKIGKKIGVVSVVAGGPEIVLNLEGTALDKITEIKLLLHGVVSADFGLKLDPQQGNTRRVHLTAKATAKAGQYTVRLLAQNQVVDVAKDLVLVEVKAPAKVLKTIIK